MKKILYSICICITVAISGQENRIVIEIDNTQKNIYDATLNKLRTDYYKRENADMIKNHADKYFTNLQRVADSFSNIAEEKRTDLHDEIERLKIYGINILNLLPILQKDELTPSNLKYTIDKANDELKYSVEQGQIKKLMPFIALSKIRQEVFPTASDEVLLIMLEKLTGWSEEQIFSMHFKVENEISFRDFLIKSYEQELVQKYK